MYLFDKLPQEDVKQLNSYLNNYSDGGYINEEQMGHFLRFWDENKEVFFHMFGEQFILRKDILFEKPVEDLTDEMDNEIRWGNHLIKDFTNALKHRLEEVFPNDSHTRFMLYSLFDDMEVLVKNVYPYDSVTIPATATVNHRAFQVNHGCKASKMVGKLAEALGVKVTARMCANGHMDIEDDVCPYCGTEVKEMDGYEVFRRAHSLVLNQKKIKGELCLSIHPLDFLTMSDNDCGWTSCMSWMEDFGDYRLGTIEMMNSSCVVIAYVEAKDKLWVCGRDWSNKRWRQLYIVTPEMILGNRQYPFESDILQGTVIRWLREMASKTMGFGPYAEEASNIVNHNRNCINGDTEIYFSIESEYMYNDVYDKRLAYIAPTYFENISRYNLNFSGPAVCCQCGEVIDRGDVEAYRVLCRACDGYWKCDCCGDVHSEYDESYCVGDYVYCEWCYTNELEKCDACCERDTHMNHIYIQDVHTQNEEIIRSFNYTYYISLCDSCVDDEKSYIDDYGPIYEVTDMWGHRRKAFDISNITDRGLRCGDLDSHTIAFLQAMRGTDGDEGRLALIREISY